MSRALELQIIGTYEAGEGGGASMEIYGMHFDSILDL